MHGIPYEKFLYLWPPRPQTTIKPGSKHFEAMKKRAGYCGQLKLNGQRSPIYIDPDMNVALWNRHGGRHLNYNVPAWLVEQVQASVKHTGMWLVIDGELLHAKDKSIKNTLYWWDVLVFEGCYLIGTTYEHRHEMLREIVDVKEDDGGIAKVTDNIWLADIFSPDKYDEMWKRTQTSWVEGFVFKKLDAKLQPCVRQKNNESWQLRCRRKSNSYRF